MVKTYSENLEIGLEYQDIVTERFYNDLKMPIVTYNSRERQYSKGENMAGVEIKFDSKSLTSKNVYIEYEEKSKAEYKNYKPSGVYRNDNSWLFVIGNRTTTYILSKCHLRERCDVILKDKNHLGYFLVKTPTSKAILFPKEEIAAMSVQILGYDDNGKLIYKKVGKVEN